MLPGAGATRGGGRGSFPATAGRPEVVVAPQDWFTNGEILEYDQAGIAVRMIGAGDSVQWFAPNYGDLARTILNSRTNPRCSPMSRGGCGRWSAWAPLSCSR